MPSMAIVAPALLALWAYLVSLPLAVWVTVAGVVSVGSVATWWAVSKASPAVKVKQLLTAADLLDSLAVRPLEAIAPMTPTTADDKALLYLRQLVVAMREAAATGESMSLPAAHIPAPSVVAGNTLEAFIPPHSVPARG